MSHCTVCGDDKTACCVGQSCNVDGMTCTKVDSKAGAGGSVIPKNTCLEEIGGNGQYCSGDSVSACLFANECSSDHVCECTDEKRGQVCAAGRVCEPSGAKPAPAPPGPGSPTKVPSQPSGGGGKCPAIDQKPGAGTCDKNAHVGMCYDESNSNQRPQCLTAQRYQDYLAKRATCAAPTPDLCEW